LRTQPIASFTWSELTEAPDCFKRHFGKENIMINTRQILPHCYPAFNIYATLSSHL
jgi:hypothetical protein